MVSKTMAMSNHVDDLPSYEELPVVDGTDLRHAWDVFDPASGLGTLHHLTPGRRLDALASAREGRTIGLGLPLGEPLVPPFGRVGLRHEVYPANGFSWGDRLDGLDLQASTQWDGLLHVQHREAGFYGGHPGPPADAPHLGIDAWGRSGIVGRGVLVDVGAWLEAQGPYDALERRAVSPDDLLAAVRAQGTEILPGDVLCVRLGWYAAFRTLSVEDARTVMTRPVGAGLAAGPATAAFLWDERVAAVACDNVTVEVQPGDKADGFLHHRLLTMLGMPLGELFDFEELARSCRERGRWDFLFVSVPLNLPGGVGSPGNAVAVV
ncbi:hypothetical protein ASD11_16955 [Aeromicrobium sp. Root495]|nr:hypothetical protein ASD11_16955 [Aeromicrobium sp. Root495]